jgi:alpha-glucosidase
VWPPPWPSHSPRRAAGPPARPARQPIPRLRRATPALRHGGLCWAHVDADTLCFLREAATDRLLVLARRATAAPVRVAGVHARVATNVYRGAVAPCEPDGSVLLPDDGPTTQIWRLQ